MAEQQTGQQPVQVEQKAPLTSAQKQEAIVRVTINEGSKPKDTAVGAHADKLNKKLKEEGPRGMMRSLVDDIDSLSVNKEVPNEKSKKVVENTIGWNKNEKGEKQLDEGEKARLNDANNRIKDVNDYLIKDYGALTTEQKNHIVNDATQLLRSIPAFNNFLEGLPDKGKSTIEGLLRNAEFKAKVSGVLNGTLDKVKLNNEDVNKMVVETNKELETAKAEKKLMENALKDVNKNIKENELELNKFDLNQETEGGKGENLARLEQLQKDDPINKSEIQKRQTDITDINKKIEDLRIKQQEQLDAGVEAADVYTDRITKLTEQLGVLEKEKGEFAAKRKELRDLKQQRKDLQEKKQKLDQDKTNFARQYEEAVVKALITQTAFEQVSGEKLKYEQEFINEINNTFSESTKDFLREKIRAAENADRRLENETVESDEIKKKFKDAFNSRWVSDAKRKEGKWLGFREERDTVVANKKQIAEDFSKLLKGGPEGVMKEILMTNCGMSPDEADTKLKDQAFVKEMGDKVIDQVISRKFQNGQITGDEVMQIANSEMGMEAMKRAVAKNKEIGRFLNEAAEEGVLKGSTPAEWARQIRESNSTKKDTILTLLLSLIFGVPLLAVFAGKEIKKALDTATV